MRTYYDFNIEMTDLRDDGTFKVRVVGLIPGGEMSAGAAVTATFSPDDFKQLIGKLDRRKASQEELIRLGERLADLLLPGRVRALYDKSLHALKEDEGLRLRLRIEPLTLAAFELQVVLEALSSDRTDAEIARAYEIHPVTLSNWKKKLKENGAKAFGSGNELKEKEKKIAKLERMIGQKEVEIALLKNFLGEG